MSSTFFGRRFLGSSVVQILRERLVCNGLVKLPQKSSESNIHTSAASCLIKQYVDAENRIEEEYKTFRRRVVRDGLFRVVRRQRFRIEPSKERYLCERRRYRRIKQKQFAQALDVSARAEPLSIEASLKVDDKVFNWLVQYVKILRNQEQEEEHHRIKENRKIVMRNSILKEALSALRNSDIHSKN